MNIQRTGRIKFYVDKKTLDLLYSGKMTDYPPLQAELIYPHNPNLNSKIVFVEILNMEPAPFRDHRAPREKSADVRSFDYLFVEMGMRHLWYIDALIEEELVYISYFEGLDGFATYSCLAKHEVTTWYKAYFSPKITI